MEQSHIILIVDDAEINRSMLADMLSEHYTVLEAADGVEAIRVIEKQRESLSLILLDIMMPRMDGFGVLSYMRENESLRDIPVIMISAETSSLSIDRAYDLGAADYISRPFDEKTVQRRVKNTIMLYAKQRMLEGMVTTQIMVKEHDNLLMVELLSNIVEFRNSESGMHVLHIRTITSLLLHHLVQMTDRYSLSAEQIALIANAAALHDIGKISIPEHILNKSGRLTEEERAVMQQHTIIGAQMLENASGRQREPLVRIAHDICRWHHERYDGCGYPDGLKGEEIPIPAQVVALADVYDALTNERVYKPAYSHEAAMSMILNGECGVFSPLLLQCLVEMGPRIAREMLRGASKEAMETEVAGISSQFLGGGKASSRTLSLLEQERTKYQFFASMSKEILFEYDIAADLLTISEGGSVLLGLNEVIQYPFANAELQKVISYDDLKAFAEKLRRVDPADPVVRGDYSLTVRGQKRWYKAVSRPLWMDDEHVVMTGVIGKLSDVHEDRLQLEKLRKKAEQDPLTKLYNHTYAREAIEAVMQRRPAKTCALILFDLDMFKIANDQYGHMFGDEILKEVARRITCNISPDDIAARIGGDEFLIFTFYEDEAETIVDRLFLAVCGKYKGFEVSLSMGVSTCPKDGQSYEMLFHRADQALYAAKQHGKSQRCFYNDSVKSTLSVISPVESDLAEAKR